MVIIKLKHGVSGYNYISSKKETTIDKVREAYRSIVSDKWDGDVISHLEFETEDGKLILVSPDLLKQCFVEIWEYKEETLPDL